MTYRTNFNSLSGSGISREILDLREKKLESMEILFSIAKRFMIDRLEKRDVALNSKFLIKLNFDLLYNFFAITLLLLHFHWQKLFSILSKGLLLKKMVEKRSTFLNSSPSLFLIRWILSLSIARWLQGMDWQLSRERTSPRTNFPRGNVHLDFKLPSVSTPVKPG